MANEPKSRLDESWQRKTANKDHKCGACRRVIYAGEVYATRAVFEGEPIETSPWVPGTERQKMCVDCYRGLHDPRVEDPSAIGE